MTGSLFLNNLQIFPLLRNSEVLPSLSPTLASLTIAEILPKSLKKSGHILTLVTCQQSEPEKTKWLPEISVFPARTLPTSREWLVLLSDVSLWQESWLALTTWPGWASTTLSTQGGIWSSFLSIRSLEQHKPKETNAAHVVCPWPPGRELPWSRKMALAVAGIRAQRGWPGWGHKLYWRRTAYARGTRPRAEDFPQCWEALWGQCPWIRLQTLVMKVNAVSQ